MGSVQIKQYYRVAFVFTILCVCNFRQALAMRPLEGDHWLNKNNDSRLQFESLKGKVPSRGNPCTNLPRRTAGNGRCSMEMVDVAAADASDVAREAFPGADIVKFGGAVVVVNDIKKQV